MKALVLGHAALLAASVLPLPAQTAVAPRAGGPALESVAEFSFAGGSPIAQGTLPLGDISSRQSLVTIVSPQHPLGSRSAWLIGASWQSFRFRAPAAAPIPDSLHAVAVKLGWDIAFDDRWSFRAEIDPGLYGERGNLGSGSFDAPMGFRFVRAARRDLQWIFGFNVDPRSGHPFVGGIGARWQFAPDWTLLAVLPAPRVEWRARPGLTLSAGANLRSGAFRVAENFGRRHARPELDAQVVDYREIGAGLGARWQLTPTLALNIAAGWVLDRRFEFHERNLLLNGDGAPSAQFTLTGTF